MQIVQNAPDKQTGGRTAAYVLPFAIFMAFVVLRSILPLPLLLDEVLRVVVVTGALWMVSRPVLDFRVTNWAASALLGLGIFVIWILPDVVWPAYRHSVLFDNVITGTVNPSFDDSVQADAITLLIRGIRAVLLVPVIEELFWRGWLSRWLVEHHFETVPLGRFTTRAFWAVAILFAAEHGPYWDVGLVAGILFNLWIKRTRSLGDLIFAHAMANLALSVYVVATGKWQYWG